MTQETVSNMVTALQVLLRVNHIALSGGRGARVTSLVVLVLLVALAGASSATDRCVTPQHAVLTLRNALESREMPAVLPGAFEAMQLVNRTSVSLFWIGAALDHGDSMMVWPRGQRVWLLLRDSTVVRDSMALVVEPVEFGRFSMHPYPALGLGTLRLEPGEL